MTKRTRTLTFALLCTASVLFWWHFLITNLGLALTSEAHTHILLVLPLTAALIYVDSKYLDSKHTDSKALGTDPQPSRGVGVALLVLALLIGCYGRWGMVATPSNAQLSLSMFGLVLWWIGSVLLCFGAKIVRVLFFPLCFLFWMVPIPEAALGWIVHFLQHQSALAARIMFSAIGTPVTQDGIMLSIPGLDIEVAHECSSIRSSLMLVVTTMVLAHLFLRSWWRKALLIAAAIPLSVAKNGLRIFTIGELGTGVDPGFLDGRLHHHGGIIFFGIAVLAVVALLWILRRTESGTPLKRPVESEP